MLINEILNKLTISTPLIRPMPNLVPLVSTTPRVIVTLSSLRYNAKRTIYFKYSKPNYITPNYISDRPLPNN